jgi:hypothetical protein
MPGKLAALRRATGASSDPATNPTSALAPTHRNNQRLDHFRR